MLTEDQMRRVESAMLPDDTGNEEVETEQRRDVDMRAPKTIRLLERQGRQNIALRELMRIERDGREPGEALFTPGRRSKRAGPPWKNPEWIFVVAE